MCWLGGGPIQMCGPFVQSWSSFAGVLLFSVEVRDYVSFMYVASQHMFILMLNLPVIRCNQQLLMKNIYHMQNKRWHWHHFRRLCVCGCECTCLQEKGTEPQRGHPTPFTRNKSSTPPRSLLSFHLVYRETWWWREGRKMLMHTPKIEN